MDLTKIKLLNMMQSNLNYMSSRQSVISQNIANANTPGYQAKDLKKPDFSSFMASAGGSAASSSSSGLTQTNSMHIAASTLSGGDYRKINSEDGYEVTPTGNKVVLEDEVMKLSRVGLEYQETTSMYSKMIGMIKTAIGSV